MRDLIGKLSKLEATAPKAPKAKRMLTEDSVSPAVPQKPSLKDVFAQLSETVQPGQKPLPVMDPQKKQAGMGFVTSDNPAVQNMLKNLDPKDVQIVQAPGQQPTGQQPQQQQQGVPGTNPGGATANKGGATNAPMQEDELDEKWAGDVKLNPAKKGMFKGKTKAELEKQLAALHKSGPHKKGSPEYTKQQELNFAIRAKSGWKEDVEEGAKVDRMVKHIEKSERKLGKSKEKASDIAWATANKRGMLDNKNKKKKTDEADIPSTQGIDNNSPFSGSARSMTTLEGAKPDFLDLDKDGNKKESMKKAAADKKKKKKVDESMNHRISAARLEGKSHGLRGHAHCGKSYEDLDERKAYCEGYKDGLDECYGMGVYETAPAMPAATVPGMASASMPTMEDDMEEGNAFTAALAKTPKGGKFSVGGKSFTDHSNYDSKLGETDYAFESWDNQLNSLLNEGLSVSVSKGQQNSPDSVTITAQDAEADQLLQLVKHAGLGLFGDDHAEPSSAMSVQPSQGAPDEVGAGGAEIDVVDDSDGMLALMKKLGGVEASGEEDYTDEEGCEGEEETNEATCNECGMMETQCGCSHDDEEMVGEEESEDQMEYEVAEDNAPDSGAEDSVADEDAEAKEDAALAGEKEEEMNESFFDLLGRLSKLAESKEEDEEDEEDVTEAKEEDEEDEEDVTEGLNEWANQVGKGPGKGTDASFEQDIEFMTKVIAGGLNKPKSTGQTTAPIIAGQEDRMHDNPKDWATLAGIKKA